MRSNSPRRHLARVALAVSTGAFQACAQSLDATPESSLDAARRLLGEQRYDEAADRLEPLANAAPTDPELSLLLGLAYYGANRPQDAVSPLEKAAAQEREISFAHQFLGRVYFRLERFDEAASALEKALTIEPDDASTVNQLGAVLLELGDVKGARARFDRATLLDPRLAPAQFNAGVLRFLDGDANGAEAFLFRAAELAPSDADAPIVLGDLYAGTDRPRAARDWYEVAAERLPDSVVAAQRVADQSARLFDLATAWRWQRVVLARAPQDVEAWVATYALALRRGDLVAATAALERCCELEPGNLVFRRRLADFLHDRGDRRAARDELSRVARAGAAGPEVWARISRLSEELGDESTALAAFRTLVESESDAAETLRCVADRMLGSNVAGIRNESLGTQLASALVERSQGQDAAALLSLARFAASRGENALAAANYERAAEVFDQEAPAARVLRERADRARRAGEHREP